MFIGTLNWIDESKKCNCFQRFIQLTAVMIVRGKYFIAISINNLQNWLGQLEHILYSFSLRFIEMIHPINILVLEYYQYNHAQILRTRRSIFFETNIITFTKEKPDNSSMTYALNLSFLSMGLQFHFRKTLVKLL